MRDEEHGAVFTFLFFVVEMPETDIKSSETSSAAGNSTRFNNCKNWAGAYMWRIAVLRRIAALCFFSQEKLRRQSFIISGHIRIAEDAL